jgi:ABC-type polysaccharide/polyol phosphate transport system ATPase subunit
MSTSSVYDSGPAGSDGASVCLDAVALRFRLYGDRFPSLKQAFFGRLRGRRAPRTDFWLYDCLSLQLPAGCRLGLIGRNAAGKSTLLKMICGVYHPTRGAVRVRGRIAPLIELGAGMNPELSGRENVLLNGAILGLSRRQMLQKIEPIFEFAGLGDHRDLAVKYYSTGMLMRLAFAIATDVDPQVLLIDEVFSVGDAEFMARARQRLDCLVDQSHIVVVVSHQMEQIQRLCNRAVWLDQGRIAADGPPDAVIAAYTASLTPAGKASATAPGCMAHYAADRAGRGPNQ